MSKAVNSKSVSYNNRYGIRIPTDLYTTQNMNENSRYPALVIESPYGGVKDLPSGAGYYNGNGKTMSDLDVHKHWNNPEQKKYSRNLGREKGIEPIYLPADKM